MRSTTRPSSSSMRSRISLFAASRATASSPPRSSAARTSSATIASTGRCERSMLAIRASIAASGTS